MKVLFIGGTGNISSACVALAVARGHRVTVLTRGTRPVESPGADAVRGDRNNAELLSRVAREGRFDVIANFVGFTPEQVEKDIRAFDGQTAQYLFISSASAYQKPANHYVITESTPLCNPFWQYSRDKIACEDRLLRAYRQSGFPMTIVRPSYTYGETWIPCSVGGHGYTVVDRMRRGKAIISHGDGQSLWVFTHTSDFSVGFIGLFGNPLALGEAFHITSDEVLTWDAIYRTIAAAAGCQAEIVHMSSEFIAALYPELGPGLLGDKAHSVVFDNAKIKRAVPEFRAQVPFAQGVRRSLAWHDADPDNRHIVNQQVDGMMDDLIARNRAARRGDPA